MRIDCPTCGRVLEDVAPTWKPRPFCSARCKVVDLGVWLDEGYRVSETLDPELAAELGRGSELLD